MKSEKKELIKEVVKVAYNTVIECGIGVIGGCLVTRIMGGNCNKLAKFAAIIATGAVAGKITSDISEFTEDMVDDTFELIDVIGEIRETLSSASDETI